MTTSSLLDDLRILVVEDEAFIAFALREIMTEAGAAKVATAMTLQEARAALQDTSWDVVFLDLRLPDGTAHALAEELVAEEVAVVIHSGNADSGMLGDLPRCAFCPKPATKDTVIRVVREALDRSHSAEAPAQP